MNRDIDKTNKTKRFPLTFPPDGSEIGTDLSQRSSSPQTQDRHADLFRGSTSAIPIIDARNQGHCDIYRSRLHRFRNTNMPHQQRQNNQMTTDKQTYTRDDLENDLLQIAITESIHAENIRKNAANIEEAQKTQESSTNVEQMQINVSTIQFPSYTLHSISEQFVAPDSKNEDKTNSYLPMPLNTELTPQKISTKQRVLDQYIRTMVENEIDEQEKSKLSQCDTDNHQFNDVMMDDAVIEPMIEHMTNDPVIVDSGEKLKLKDALKR